MYQERSTCSLNFKECCKCNEETNGFATLASLAQALLERPNSGEAIRLAAAISLDVSHCLASDQLQQLVRELQCFAAAELQRSVSLSASVGRAFAEVVAGAEAGRGWFLPQGEARWISKLPGGVAV